MSSLTDCQFYCLSFNDETRKKDMENRFKNLGIECKFYKGVSFDDPRINKSLNRFKKRQWSMTYGHLDILNDFINNNTKKCAIICEDDINFIKRFKEILGRVICDFDVLELDILLLGYLIPYKIGDENLFTNYKLKKPMPPNSFFKYHNYPEYLNGTQMYIISRKHAKCLLHLYYSFYAGFGDKYFNPDKILIRDGNKALIYPMLAIENNKQKDLYHQLCRNVNCVELYT